MERNGRNMSQTTAWFQKAPYKLSRSFSSESDVAHPFTAAVPFDEMVISIRSLASLKTS